MQRQQVNLLQDALYERKLWLSAQRMLVIVILALALVVMWSYWQHYRLTQVTQATNVLAIQTSQKQQTISALRTRIGYTPDLRLQNKVDRMQAELQHLQALQGIAFEPFEQTQLTAFLRGIARQRPEGLWLTYIHVGTSGHDIVLEGRAVDVELLLSFITALGLEQVFFGMAFREVMLADEVKNDATEISFRLVAGCEDNRCRDRP